MERLTMDTNGKAGVGLTFSLDVDCPNMDEAEKLQDLIIRLGRLEKAVADDAGEYDLDRLRELAQADREGRCVVLPCKVGDTVYRIQRYFDDAKLKSRYKVKMCKIASVSIDSFCTDDFVWCLNSDIGKTVFLTRKKAETALAQKGAEHGTD